MKFGYMLFYVADVEKSLEFFEGALGLARKFYNIENDQAYGELESGATTIGFISFALAKAQGIEFSKPDPRRPAPACDIGFVTENVKEAYDRAIDHGTVPIHAPEQKPWGQTVSYVRDPNGFLVSINSQVEQKQ